MGSPKVPKNGNRKRTPKNAVSRNSISRCHQIVKDCERSLLTIKNNIKSHKKHLHTVSLTRLIKGSKTFYQKQLARPRKKSFNIHQ